MTRRRRSVPLLLGVTVLVATLGAACRESPRPRQAIFILLDAARADRFSSYGYGRETTPRMDRIAREGTLFTHHYVQSTATRGSLPQLFYSRYFVPALFPNSPHVPLQKPADLFIHDPTSRSLPRALAAAGLTTAAVSAHAWIKPGTPFAAQFDELRDLSGQGGGRPYASARQVVDGAFAWLEDRLDEDYFLYLHLMDTHFPHYLDEDARRFWDGGSRPERIAESGWVRYPQQPLDVEARRYLDAVYDGSLRFADRELGRLFDFLARHDRLDRTLILITADHGEHLFEQPGRETHGGPWLEPVARVPLLVRYPPAVEPQRIATLTEGVDLYPTILKLLDLEPPAGSFFDGRDLFDPADRDVAVGRRGIRDQRFTLLLEMTDNAVLAGETLPADLRARLYDRRSDPAETRDVSRRHPDVVRRLAGAYRERLRRPFQRYRQARANVQPTESFAIAAVRFEVPGVSWHAGPVPGTCADLGSEPGWRGRAAPNPGYVAATPGAEPLRLEIPMPDGRYRVTAVATGTAQIRLDGAAGGVQLTSDVFDPRGYDPAAASDLGEIEVVGERFGAEIEPGPDDCFLLWLLGFEPRPDGDGRPPVETQDVERLRALGYVG